MADQQRYGMLHSFWDRMPNSILHPDNFPDYLKGPSFEPAAPPDPNSPSYRQMPELGVDDAAPAQAGPQPIYPFGDLNGRGYHPVDGDTDLPGRLLFAEGAGTPRDFPALAWSAVNRVGMPDKGGTLSDVVHQKNAYEALTKGRLWDAWDHPESLAPADKAARDQAIQAAAGVLTGFIPDPTGGATMFLPSSAYNGNPASAPGDYPRMFREGRLAPSPYNSSPSWPGTNYFFIERPPGKSTR